MNRESSEKRRKMSPQSSCWDLERWKYAEETLRRYVTSGVIAEAEVHARCFNGSVPEDVHARACSAPEKEEYAPRLFRMASMTKAVVSFCALQWLERGLFSLQSPISEWIPELADPDVLDAITGKRRKANGVITVKMLLNHTSGLSYRFQITEPEAVRVRPFYVKYDVFDIPSRPEHTSDELLARLSKCPLAFDPGTRFCYSLGTDVLGILLSRATGKSLDTLLREGIFEPCCMQNTFFHLPPDRTLSDLFEPTVAGEDNGIDPQSSVRIVPDKVNYRWELSCDTSGIDESSMHHNESGSGEVGGEEGGQSHGTKNMPPPLPSSELPWPLIFHPTFCYSAAAREAGTHMSGGAGLLSTGEDYLKFLTAWLAAFSGRPLELDATPRDVPKPILSRKIAELMARDSLPSHLPRPMWIQGFGLGFAIWHHPACADQVCSPGSVYWAGIFGTNYFIDLSEGCAAVLLTQRYPQLPPGNLSVRYQQLVLQALATKPRTSQVP